MRQQHQTIKDTIELMPASLLPFKQEWQALADSLPEGACLIVLPEDNPKIQEQLLGLARAFENKGRGVVLFTSHQPERVAGKKHPQGPEETVSTEFGRMDND
jgi:hypothetical protein